MTAKSIEFEKVSLIVYLSLSHEQKSFSQFLVVFSKSRLNFELFEKKDNSHKFCISEITNSQNVVR